MPRCFGELGVYFFVKLWEIQTIALSGARCRPYGSYQVAISAVCEERDRAAPEAKGVKSLKGKLFVK